MMMPMKGIQSPDKVSSFFKSQWKVLTVVTVTGILYNFGLLVGPIFEGKLAQSLLDLYRGQSLFSDILILAALYVLSTLVVQFARYVKRLYVRRFANNINRSMKHILYANLIHKSKVALDSENIGSLMTKAISDVDQCAEGMRKFTTEVFDTGIAFLCYAGLLVVCDWKLALASLLISCLSYLIAEKLKGIVEKTGRAFKESSGRLNSVVLDRVSNAGLYRIYGSEKAVDEICETNLSDYEKRAVKAEVLISAMPPLYKIISMLSVIAIVFFGGRNVANGVWTIATFTMFLSSYAKLSTKASKAAKLFNSVQKASVSWKRIKPFMKQPETDESLASVACKDLKVKDLGYKTENGTIIFEGLSFTAKPGSIIGITGPVASGKSTLGKVFLCERPYVGSAAFGETELSSMKQHDLYSCIGYLGHDTELLSDSIEENILLGSDVALDDYLKAVCFDHEISQMPEGIQTRIGSGGIRLSGGQQQRVALARTLVHKKPVLVLDDPFSALDKTTEMAVFENLRAMCSDSIILLISHRLTLFPQMDNVIWMEDGKASLSDHESLMASNAAYKNLYEIQEGENK